MKIKRVVIEKYNYRNKINSGDNDSSLVLSPLRKKNRYFQVSVKALLACNKMTIFIVMTYSK